MEQGPFHNGLIFPLISPVGRDNICCLFQVCHALIDKAPKALTHENETKKSFYRFSFTFFDPDYHCLKIRKLQDNGILFIYCFILFYFILFIYLLLLYSRFSGPRH